MSPALPNRARIVIIGGGVIGSSIAYHLAHLGESDVLLLERDRLTSGTTWHAAGLMTCFGSTRETSTRMRLYSRELYARLEAETGQATGFRPVGLIEAAADADRLEEYRRVAAFQRHIGLEVHEIGPAEMSELFPLAKTDDLVAGFYVPGDGRVNPVDLTMSLARGARQLGVQVAEGVSVERVLTRRRGLVEEVVGVSVVDVRTGERSEIECDRVINCAGMWARELGERNGVVIPNQAAEHYYLITEPIEGMSPDAPVFEDPAAYGYYREEGGGMMVGLFEPVAAPWRVEGIPADFSFGEIKPDWDRMGPFVERAMARVPITETVGIRTFFCGPESFTPDLLPAVGEAPGIRMRGPELRRSALQWRHGSHCGAMDFEWSARCGCDRVQCGSLPPMAARSALPCRANGGNPGDRVCRTHAGPAAALRARRAALPGPCGAGGSRGISARRLRLGERGLVCRRGRECAGVAHLGSSPVV